MIRNVEVADIALECLVHKIKKIIGLSTVRKKKKPERENPGSQRDLLYHVTQKNYYIIFTKVILRIRRSKRNIKIIQNCYKKL